MCRNIQEQDTFCEQRTWHVVGHETDSILSPGVSDNPYYTKMSTSIADSDKLLEQSSDSAIGVLVVPVKNE